jgi:glutamate synthase domain-containing protein 3
LTGSVRARGILDNWQQSKGQFWRVAPKPSVEDATAKEQDVHLVEQAALEALRLEAGQQAATAAD